MSSKLKKTRAPKKRTARQTSNIFAMFDQAQIQEFKEAFNMIDQNHDGFICKDDLKETFLSFGKEATDTELDDMLNEAPGQINFTMFLTMFGEKMNGTDPEDVIKNAFACFDEKNTGKIHKDNLINAITTLGERFTKEEADLTLKSVPMDQYGYIDYAEFAHIIKHGTKEEVQI
ncbi:Myosin regulatory light polypeptide 9 [Thelohanellus kitauei]|uniref:Myosin regulatory light polypeptide 9 n=1 Tax=Thelohanellus kitauei TaxID=669202 RepID=A0A0C2N8E9_THEKT|nr:Myosin regulatory light polypeptide 9 [Thelohanellus kitauei]